jgi:hypothetical protein
MDDGVGDAKNGEQLYHRIKDRFPAAQVELCVHFDGDKTSPTGSQRVRIIEKMGESIREGDRFYFLDSGELNHLKAVDLTYYCGYASSYPAQTQAEEISGKKVIVGNIGIESDGYQLGFKSTPGSCGLFLNEVKTDELVASSQEDQIFLEELISVKKTQKIDMGQIEAYRNEHQFLLGYSQEPMITLAFLLMGIGVSEKSQKQGIDLYIGKHQYSQAILEHLLKVAQEPVEIISYDAASGQSVTKSNRERLKEEGRSEELPEGSLRIFHGFRLTESLYHNLWGLSQDLGLGSGDNTYTQLISSGRLPFFEMRLTSRFGPEYGRFLEEYAKSGEPLDDSLSKYLIFNMLLPVPNPLYVETYAVDCHRFEGKQYSIPRVYAPIFELLKEKKPDLLLEYGLEKDLHLPILYQSGYEDDIERIFSQEQELAVYFEGLQPICQKLIELYQDRETHEGWNRIRDHIMQEHRFTLPTQ